MHRERFAPSPTGLLHLGHAYSAKLGYDAAMDASGEWILRIEDIDFARSRPEFVEQIYEDVDWLGMRWPQPVLVQSARKVAYDAALNDLRARGLVYGCKCTRGDIKAAMSARNEGDTPNVAYPGTCRDKMLEGDNLAWRLNMTRAVELLPALSYREIGQDRDEIVKISNADLLALGDIVLARRDIGTSYHLAVVVDDAHQEISHVTRGADLEEDTKIHVLLQSLLSHTTPIYRHHQLIRDENGKRLAKRDDSRAIKLYRDEGMTINEFYKFMKKNA